MNTLPFAARRAGLIALVVVTVLVGRRFVPQSLGFGGRLAVLVGLVVLVLWTVSFLSRQAAARSDRS